MICFPVLDTVVTPHDLRLFICSHLKLQIDDGKLYWVTNISPEVWLKQMQQNAFWCDDVFLQITSNVLILNIILIPLNPSSSHHAGMYSDIRAFDGASGEPIYMLYFEEWR